MATCFVSNGGGFSHKRAAQLTCWVEDWGVGILLKWILAEKNTRTGETSDGIKSVRCRNGISYWSSAAVFCMTSEELAPSQIGEQCTVNRNHHVFHSTVLRHSPFPDDQNGPDNPDQLWPP